MSHELKLVFDRARKEVAVTDSMGIEIIHGPECRAGGLLGTAVARLDKKEKRTAKEAEFKRIFGP